MKKNLLTVLTIPQQATSRVIRFTLIELLVVIAIIGILAALLLPALKQAKEMAKQATCINNQKQCGILLSLYQNDFNECSPGACSRIGDAALGFWSKFIDGQPVNSAGDVDDGYYGGNDPYGTGTVLRCPKNKQADSSGNVYGVYDVATNNSEDEDFMLTVKNEAETYIYDYFKMSAMPAPAEFMMLGCSLNSYLDTKSFQWYGVYKFRRTSVSSASNANSNWGLWMVHLKTCTGMFGDSHVETMSPGALWKTRNGYIADGNQGIRAWKLEDGTHVLP